MNTIKSFSKLTQINTELTTNNDMLCYNRTEPFLFFHYLDKSSA